MELTFQEGGATKKDDQYRYNAKPEIKVNSIFKKKKKKNLVEKFTRSTLGFRTFFIGFSWKLCFT